MTNSNANGEKLTIKEEPENIGHTPTKANLKGDRFNLLLIVILYFFQGLPIGISVAIKTFIQGAQVPYHQQAKYSMVDLPFSLKLFWAPLVDAMFFRAIGRRKTWIVPVQYLIGCSFILLGFNINRWLANTDHPQMTVLTLVMFFVNTIAATQDIVIDGCALTMLKEENRCYVSMCSTTGQGFGVAFGYTVFVLLESEKFCNRWLRTTSQNGGLITMETYLFFWGLVFVTSSTCIALFKTETYTLKEKESWMNISDTYKRLMKVLRLQAIKRMALVIVTYEIAFAALDAVSNPKFMEYGVAKEDIVIVDLTLLPMKIIIPFVVSKYTTGPNPMNAFVTVMPYRLCTGLCAALLIFYTPNFINECGDATGFFFTIYEIHRVFRAALSVTMYMSIQSFFTRAYDPRLGGTYITLLNTLSYCGISVAKTTALGMLEILTIKKCTIDPNNSCVSNNATSLCQRDGGDCDIVMDGYYVEVVICTIFGAFWCVVLKHVVRSLQRRKVDEWRVTIVKPKSAFVLDSHYPTETKAALSTRPESVIATNGI